MLAVAMSYILDTDSYREFYFLRRVSEEMAAVFLDPSPTAMSAMGYKIELKSLAMNAGVN